VVLVVLLVALVAPSLATIGFDLSYFQGDVSQVPNREIDLACLAGSLVGWLTMAWRWDDAQSAFNCLAQNGNDFGIIQATAGTGTSHAASKRPRSRKHPTHDAAGCC